GLARLADVPVLAEPARQVAAGGAERQHRRAREKVIERLLLDRVDAEAARAPEGGEDDRVLGASANEAQPALAFAELAGARAHVARDVAVGKAVPVRGRDDRCGHLVRRSELP